MQTQLADFIRATPEGLEAEAILRKCVHCGFCTATCPTYQLLGDDLDSPRGRIYLIKGALEGGPITERTRLHLDRCLTCRACETACPSGVKYGRLVDIGRNLVESRTTRSAVGALQEIGARIRAAANGAVPRGAQRRPARRAVLPRALRARIRRPPSAPGTWPHRVTNAGCSHSPVVCSRRLRRRSTPLRRVFSTGSGSRSSRRRVQGAAARCGFT
jgi:glycolate oxidase iron-sulfur subunit